MQEEVNGAEAVDPTEKKKKKKKSRETESQDAAQVDGELSGAAGFICQVDLSCNGLFPVQQQVSCKHAQQQGHGNFTR